MSLDLSGRCEIQVLFLFLFLFSFFFLFFCGKVRMGQMMGL